MARSTDITKAQTKHEVVRDASDKLEEHVDEEVLPEERKVQFRTPGFSRMSTQWSGPDRTVVQAAKAAVEGRLLEDFGDVYRILHRIYDKVRMPEVDADGVKVTDQWGFPVWQRDETGDYIEDWSELTLKEKEDFLFTVTTRLVEWEQRAADAWGEAMLAKAKWEERFAIGYDAPMGSLTVDDRKAKANKDSTDERYFAIYLSWYSRQAEALVRSVERLGQRIKDTMQ